MLRKMVLKTLSAAQAGKLDEELLSAGGFSLDQLMELAGLAVAQAVWRLHPPTDRKRVLVVCGPGNNGGDGLVAARHLRHWGYRPTVHWPRRGKHELYERLATQLRDVDVPFADAFHAALDDTDHVVDAVFGFSFSGEVREPFPAIIAALETTTLPVLAVDAPSAWNIATGPPDAGPGKNYMPDALISLTAPKPLVLHFTGRHFIGGRFLSPAVAARYGLDVPPYEGTDQVVEVDAQGHKL